jgi:hypothetical protein
MHAEKGGSDRVGDDFVNPRTQPEMRNEAMTEPAIKLDTLLRVYNIAPDGWDQFLALWRRIVVVRRRFGFEVLFALADRQENIFTWAVRHDEDIDEVAARYYADPERKELEIIGEFVTDYKVTRVGRVDLPSI